MADQNWFLIIIIIVVAVLVLGINVYVLIHYQHPEDRNQAYIPKLVVVLGLSIVYWSVLLLPLDVANRAACDQEIVVSACELTLPMKELWYFVYLTNAALVALVIPFTIFYYDADEDFSFCGKIWSALQWTIMTVIVLGLILGIAYGFAGYADFEVTRLASGLQTLANAAAETNPSCIPVLDGSTFEEIEICNADASSTWPSWWPATEDWAVRVTFPVYVIAIASVIGWVLFMVFAGVGFIALPLDLMLAFFYRPRATITKSEFLERAGKIAKRAKEIKGKAQALHKQEKSGDKGRKFRKAVKELNLEMVQLEDDEIELNEIFPQGDEADTKWAFTVVGYVVSFFLGVICLGLSISWLLQVILYQLIDPPVTPFLNNLFIDLDDVWGLFGTIAFAIYCFYLIAAAVKGNAKVGLKFLLLPVHPMRPGGTLMSSFLFNVGLLLLSTVAAIQFCADAFSLYANETAISEIFGNEIENLRGIKYLYQFNVFLYSLLGFSGLTILYTIFLAITGQMRSVYGPRVRRRVK